MYLCLPCGRMAQIRVLIIGPIFILGVLGLTAMSRVTRFSRSTSLSRASITSLSRVSILRTLTGCDPWPREWISLLLLKKGGGWRGYGGKLHLQVSLDPLSVVTAMFVPLAESPGLHLTNVSMTWTRLFRRGHLARLLKRACHK